MTVSFLPVPENNFKVKVYYVKGLSINDVGRFEGKWGCKLKIWVDLRGEGVKIIRYFFKINFTLLSKALFIL